MNCYEGYSGVETATEKLGTKCLVKNQIDVNENLLLIKLTKNYQSI